MCKGSIYEVGTSVITGNLDYFSTYVFLYIIVEIQYIQYLLHHRNILYKYFEDDSQSIDSNSEMNRMCFYIIRHKYIVHVDLNLYNANKLIDN